MANALRYNKTAPRRSAARKAPARGASRVAVQKKSRAWSQPNWQLLSRVALVLLLLAVMFGLWRGWQLAQPYIDQPISKIRVAGQLSADKQQVVQQQLLPYSTGSFLSVDIESVRSALEEMSWVASAQVSRVWPDQLQVVIQEQLLVARWGTDALLSSQGYVFTAVDVQGYAHLPQLLGPEHAQDQVMQQYLIFSQALRPLGYSIEQLEMRERGSWFVTTQTGLQLLFGRDHLVEKMRRFAVVYEKELKRQIETIERVDLRYANGLAVAWRAPTDSNTAVGVAQ